MKVADGIKTTDQRTLGQVEYAVCSRCAQCSPRDLNHGAGHGRAGSKADTTTKRSR